MSNHEKVFGVCENKCFVEVTPKEEVNRMDEATNQRIDEANEEIRQIAESQIPESIVENIINEYVEEHSGGFATKVELEEAVDGLEEDLEELDSRLSGSIADISEAGKNVFDGKILNGYYDVLNNGAFIPSSSWECNKNIIPLKENTTYIMSNTSGLDSGGRLYIDSNGDVISYVANFGLNTPFTTPSGCVGLKLYSQKSKDTFRNLQVEQGSSVTEYEPFRLTAVDNVAREEINNVKVNLNNDIQDLVDIVTEGYSKKIEDISEWTRTSFIESTFTFNNDTKRISYPHIISLPYNTSIVIDTNTLYVSAFVLKRVGESYEIINSLTWSKGLFKFNGGDNYYFAFSLANGSSYSTSTAIYPNDMVADIKLFTNIAYNLIEKIPEYWETYMTDKIYDLVEKDCLIGNHGDSFVFITDTHIKGNNMYSPMLIKKIIASTSTRMVVNGGDTIENEPSKELARKELNRWKKAMSYTTELYIRGNHDNNEENSTDTSVYLSNDDYYGIMTKTIENCIDTNGKNYFIKDNASQKIRYIFLDSLTPNEANIDDEQIEWMKAKIIELEVGWTVVVFVHKFISGVDGLTGSGIKIKIALESIYNGVSAVIACVVCGHNHRDAIIESAYGFKIISTTCDASNSPYGGSGRTKGTTTEQAFDVFHIDTTNRHVYVNRIGYGNNREFDY